MMRLGSSVAENHWQLPHHVLHEYFKFTFVREPSARLSRCDVHFGYPSSNEPEAV